MLKVAGGTSCVHVCLCMSGRDITIRDESNRGTLRPSSIRKSVEEKMTSQQGEINRESKQV